MIDDCLRKSSWSAFLRRFLMFSLINLSFPVFSRRFLVSRSSRSSCFLAQCLHRFFFCCFLSFPPGCWLPPSRPVPLQDRFHFRTSHRSALARRPSASRRLAVSSSSTSLRFLPLSFFGRTTESSSSEIRSLRETDRPTAGPGPRLFARQRSPKGRTAE